MKIRTASIDDLVTITEIYNQAIMAGYKTADTEVFTSKQRKKWFIEHIAEKYPIFVAEKNNKVLGYLTISPYRTGRAALRYTAEISYYVHFDYHRQGIASNLLNYAIKICPSLDIKNIFTIILEKNEASILLMEKFGFQKWGYLPKVANFSGNEIGHLYYGLNL